MLIPEISDGATNQWANNNEDRLGTNVVNADRGDALQLTFVGRENVTFSRCQTPKGFWYHIALQEIEHAVCLSDDNRLQNYKCSRAKLGT